jgi:hypothetical protein
MGYELKVTMDNLIEDLKETLPALFETTEHQTRIKRIGEEVSAKQKRYFESLQREAEKHEMTILSTSKGFVVVPIRGGKVLSDKELESLSQKERKKPSTLQKNSMNN